LVSWEIDKTGDIVHADVLKEPTVTAMGEFFHVVKDDLPYRMKGLTSDQEGIIRWAFRRVFPWKPHQLCVKHALETLDRHLGYSRARRRIKTMRSRRFGRCYGPYPTVAVRRVLVVSGKK
jgi:hypothetical protein